MDLEDYLAEYLLYSAAESGNSYKAALMLNLAGADWSPVFVDLFNGETRTEEFRARVNEQGEVPVLEHEGKRLSQSGVILDYLAEKTGRFGGRTGEEKREILRWILFDNHKLSGCLGPLRRIVGLEKTGESAATQFLRARVLGSFAILEKHLAARSFLLGDQPTIADFSLAGYLYYPEETGIDRTQFPNIQAWTDRIRAQPGWAHPYDLMRRGLPEA